MDDLVAVLGERRPRRLMRVRRARRVDYKELLRPPVDPSQRCPHTLQVQSADQCSSCIGIKVMRIRPHAIVPEPDEE